ncbi:hypothetical protein [Myxosarcina sp. GI1]|uniref:hypothetical protein n=1 Tax=Myxosarcina sp. GI1 TaxID=1541065 RepID=UPI00155AB542|nr:hypothetical protein [Myxosarcina sp. GI1]
MFFPWFKDYSCYDYESNFPEKRRQRKLKFLKSMRDDLETRLAAINAAIDTIERQNRQD